MRKIYCCLTAILLLFGQIAFAQKSITGKVTDDKGVPLSNVTVQIKGTNTATITRNDGSFSLTTNEANPVLVISSAGYLSKTVNAANAATVTLELDTKTMSEVVVTGVGVATSKKKLAFSVETVKTDKTTPVPSADPAQFLVGKVPGAQISSVNGSPGAPLNILLRGINTLNRGTSPMILLDGVEVSATDLNTLDLNNIERIEIVQGAASASIYGAQGANGVIQLFTKKGRQGKINIDIFSSVSANTLINHNDNLQKAKFHSLQTNANGEVIGGSGNPLVFDPDYSHYAENVIWNSLDPTNTNNKPYNKNLLWYDHYKMFFQTAYTTNNSISVSGGRDRVDFNLTASDNRSNSNFKDNGSYARSNFGANIGVEIFKNFTVRNISQLAYTHNTQLDPDGRTIFYALNNSRPFANYDYKSPDGNYGAYFGDAVGVNGYNPNYQHQYFKEKDDKIDIIEAFSANYKFSKFVELDGRYGLDYQTEESIHNIADQSNNLNADYWQYWVEGGPSGGYAPRTTYGNPSTKEETGEIDHFQYKTLAQNLLLTATVRLDFKNDFHLNIPLKSTTQAAWDYRKSKFNRYITYGLDAPSYTPYTAAQMGTYKIEDDYTEPFLTYGYLVNQRFEWGDIAGVSGGFRQDWSSAFGKGATPRTFPRGDAYVRVSAFDLWNNSKLNDIIPEFKLRAAYGEAGIQPKAFDRYITLNTRNIGDNVAFSFPTSNPNPNLDVEVSKEFEAGTDMTINILKGNWLKYGNVSFTYWDRKTENAIWDVDAPPSTGIGTVKDNAFSLGSHGIQASLNLSMLSQKNFTWNFTTNFGKQTSKITSVIGPPVVLTSAAGSTGIVLKAGEKIGQLFGYLMLHSVDQVDPVTKQPYIPASQQASYTVASNGWVVNKSTKQPYVTPGQYSFGDPNPKFNMSFINDVTYKGFLNFSMQWDWVNGSHLYNQTKEWMYRDGIHKDYDKDITIDGNTGSWTAFYRGVYAQVSRNGTKNYFYEDATFWRLRNISLAFDFAKFVHIPAFQKLQLVLAGRNIFTITDYTGMDPEVSSGANNSAFDRGVDHNTIPNIKSYQVALIVGF